MTEHNHDKEIEQILRGYRPAGPSESLRERVLSSADSRPRLEPARTWRVWAFRTAVAAALVLSLTLNMAAERTMMEVCTNIGIGPVRWTKDAEQAAQMLDGDEWGRRYIALGLMASTGRGLEENHWEVCDE